jgi:hypothetical protein
MAKRIRRARFYISVTQRGEKSNAWRWQICRKWNPLTVQLHQGGFESFEEAEQQGKIALEEFLNRLALDQ